MGEEDPATAAMSCMLADDEALTNPPITCAANLTDDDDEDDFNDAILKKE